MADILLESSQIGKREDLSDLIATADRKNTPFYNTVRKGAIPKNVVFQWQMDKYNDPVADASETVNDSGTALLGTSSTVDGTDASVSAGFADSNTRKLAQNYAHTFDKTVGIGFLAEDVSTVAGAPSELARSVARRIVEMKREIEKHMLSGSNAVSQVTATGTAKTGYKTKALGSFIHEDGKSAAGGTEGSTFTVDSAFMPTSTSVANTAAPIFEGAIGLFSEELVQNMLQGIYDNTGSIRDYTGLVGTTLKRKFTNLASTNTVTNAVKHVADVVAGGDAQAFTGSESITADQIRSVNKDQASKQYISSIDVFEGDFGTITLVPDHYVDHASNGYIIPWDELELKIHTAPNVSTLTNDGGGERRLLRSIMGLAVNNPLAFGRFRSNTANA
jgi:hypothetical protein